ncbi:uncharacterized protein LOC133138223 [Conger conger]|uniref:uncharacterized protein LOC133138223 n=1 Tax=Conger conger TaxID=82655 RepID=UPI002A5AA261|nr:uncharacterized protein LOC133138223 [Conger conger]
MDDFDYSVQISERDWDAFFQECEECDLLPPALAGLDDSGTSDADDGSASLPLGAEERDSPDADYPVDEPPECTGLPVERYLGACHIPGPEDLLSCSEEDTHLESINKFFERLKGMEGGGSPRAEARPKETCAPGDPAKVPANLALVPQAKAQSDNLAVSFSPAAKEDKVGGTISAGRGYKALDGAGRAIDTESEEDDVFRSAEAAVELHIREEDWTEDEAEEWQKEKKGYLSKDKLLKATLSCSTSSKEECGLRKHTEKEFQPSRLNDMGGTEDKAREGEMKSQELMKEDTSLYGHQVELQTDPAVLLGTGRAAGAERKEFKSANEHRFMSVDVGQGGSREHFSPSVKRKRRRIWRGDPLLAGLGFDGVSGRTESKKQAERFEQEATGQGEAVSGHDSEACMDEAGRKHKSLSAHQITQSSGRVPTSSELLSEINSVKESGVDSHTAVRNHDSKESVTRLVTNSSRESIPKFPFQQQHGLGNDFQNHSQQICIPASDTETSNLTSCNQSPESLQSGGIMTQHDPISPQSAELSVPDNSSQFPLNELSMRFHIPEESSTYQKPLKYKSTLQMNSPADDKAICQLNNILLEVSSSTESTECHQPFVSDMSGSEDSRKRNIPELEHAVTLGQNLPTFSQETNRNVIRSLEISPSKEFRQMANTDNPSVPPEPSLSLNNISDHELSSCEEIDPTHIQCQISEEITPPPEYQEVEESNDVPISNEPTHHAKTNIRNINPNTSCSAPENEELSTVTSDEALLFQERQLADTQILVHSDLVPAPVLLDTYNDAIGLNTDLTECPVASDSNGNSVRSTTLLLDDSEGDKGCQTDDWLPEKGGNLPETSTVECVKKSQQASNDVSAVNEVEVALEPEVQNNLSIVTPVHHTSEDRKQAEGSGESELSLQLESTASAKSLETKELNNAVEAKRPVRTMSAFWKEMEKLTINDILCLRSASSSPGGLPRDTALMDTSEAGDSGYASHLEDTKLDRSSADVSAISDFEEECSLSHSGIVKSSLEPKDTKKQGERSLGSSNSRGVLWESKSYSAGPGMDNDANETSILCSGDSISPPFLSDKSQHGTTFRRMCKNISIQNLRALEAKPRASLLTTAAEKEELQESSGTFQRHDGGSSVPLESSDRTDMKTSAASSLLEDEATEGFGTSFREIFAYFFGAGKTGVGQADTAPTEEPAGDGGSVPEMYDHFFSEFETDFFFPFIQETDSGQNEPILTTSGSSHRNLQFPEAYDYFFPDSSSSDSDSDDDRKPVRVVSRLDESPGEPSGTGAAPDMYEHFFTGSDWRESLFWRNPLSLRRMRLTAVSGSREGPTSCVVVTADPLARSVFSTFYTDRAVDVHGAVGPQTPLYCLEERIFRDLAEKQRRYADLQTAIAVPNSPLLALKQSDMCLICIAFASWVLKTANPQDSDTWKAALLANISALSAIRYIRRYIRAREEPGNEAGL